MKNRPIVLLLSGGVDSATAGLILRDQGFDLMALSFDYGQRHEIELISAKKVAHAIGVASHKVLQLDLRTLGGSALTDDLNVPKTGEVGEGIPITYVPARNTVFLSLALGYAEVLGATDIGIGVTAVDYSGYPDCRPEFIAAFEATANLATKMGVEGHRFRVHTPLIAMSKAQILSEGIQRGFDYGLTHSCYDPSPDGQPCGLCDSCVIRLKAFAELGMADPVVRRID